MLTLMSCAVGTALRVWWQLEVAGLDSGNALKLGIQGPAYIWTRPPAWGLGQVTMSSLGWDTAEGEAQAVGKAW